MTRSPSSVPVTHRPEPAVPSPRLAHALVVNAPTLCLKSAASSAGAYPASVRVLTPEYEAPSEVVLFGVSTVFALPPPSDASTISCWVQKNTRLAPLVRISRAPRVGWNRAHVCASPGGMIPRAITGASSSAGPERSHTITSAGGKDDGSR